MRALVVNADDFGHSSAVNAGIVEAHERGIVTSTSLMVGRQAARQAVEQATAHPTLDLGLHVDLGEWSYRDADGWVALYATDEGSVEEEVVRQLEQFRSLVGRDPTHLDSHQHVHLREPARTVLRQLAGELEVPLRHLDSRVRYCGDFYGQTASGEPLPELIAPEALIALVTSLPDGITELCCHPAKGEVQGSSYAAERNRELAALCDARVRAALEREGIRLCSFGELGSLTATKEAEE